MIEGIFATLHNIFATLMENEKLITTLHNIFAFIYHTAMVNHLWYARNKNVFLGAHFVVDEVVHMIKRDAYKIFPIYIYIPHCMSLIVLVMYSFLSDR